MSISFHCVLSSLQPTKEDWAWWKSGSWSLQRPGSFCRTSSRYFVGRFYLLQCLLSRSGPWCNGVTLTFSCESGSLGSLFGSTLRCWASWSSCSRKTWMIRFRLCSKFGFSIANQGKHSCGFSPHRWSPGESYSCWGFSKWHGWRSPFASYCWNGLVAIGSSWKRSRLCWPVLCLWWG